MLTLSGLRAFVAVIETQSFTRAATQLNATQSGISQQIARLERNLGVPLILRDTGGAVTTPAGKKLYQLSVRIIRDLAETETAIRNFDQGISGSIRLGLMPAMTRSLSGPVQRRFMTDHPNVNVIVKELVSSDLIKEVAAGRIDLGIVPTFNAPDAIRVYPVGNTPEVLVHSGQRHKDHMKAVNLAELPPLRIILQSSGNIRRETILAHLKSAGVEIVEILDLDSMFGTLEFVKNSNYVTILPSIMMNSEIENAELCVRPIYRSNLDLELIAIEPSSREQSLIAPILRDGFSQTIADFNYKLINYRQS